MITLSKSSLLKIYDVEPRLQRVVHAAAAIATFPFMVTEGRRTAERQAQLVAEGRSQTMNSEHLNGSAVDLAVIKDGKPNWDDFTDYSQLAKVMFQAAFIMKVPIAWGGHWRTLKDGPHFELDWAAVAEIEGADNTDIEPA